MVECLLHFSFHLSLFNHDLIVLYPASPMFLSHEIIDLHPSFYLEVSSHFFSDAISHLASSVHIHNILTFLFQSTLQYTHVIPILLCILHSWCYPYLLLKGYSTSFNIPPQQLGALTYFCTNLPRFHTTYPILSTMALYSHIFTL